MDDHEISWEGAPLKRAPVQQRSRDKVSRALAAADEIVRQEGVEAISLPHVAERAGVSVGALYQYLPDREAIVTVLVWRYHVRFEVLLDGAIADARQDPPDGDPIDYLINAVTQIYADNQAARSLRSSANGPALEEQSRLHKGRMADKLAELMCTLGVARSAQEARPVAAVGFIAADAVFHEAFNAPADERQLLIGQLRVLLKAYLAPLLARSGGVSARPSAS